MRKVVAAITVAMFLSFVGIAYKVAPFVMVVVLNFKRMM